MSYVHQVFGQPYIWDDKLQSMRPMDLTNPNERTLVDRYRRELQKSLNILSEDVPRGSLSQIDRVRRRA